MRIRNLSRSVSRIAAIAAFGVGATLGGSSAVADEVGSSGSSVDGGSGSVSSSDDSDLPDDWTWD
jgi:hypothetical protein